MATRSPIRIPVRPWFFDHHFNGQTIFPAVESMLLLAKFACDLNPGIQPSTMLDGKFSKFLAIAEGVEELSALIEFDTQYTDTGEQLCLKLLSKIQLKQMTRIQEHARITLLLKPPALCAPLPVKLVPNSISIDSQRIYRDLVPFGRGYQSLCGRLHLTESHAWGELQAPNPGLQPMEEILGSPFPLDGAMHAACVLGQCIADFVPFPVGFKARQVLCPTRARKPYRCTVSAKSVSSEEILVDLVIYDAKDKTYEIVHDLRMRDVTGGRIRPAANLPRLTFSEP